jgi:hypothetical protein
MSMTGARTIHASPKPPILDADGHRATLSPLMRKAFRRLGGDTAVAAPSVASARTAWSLSTSVAEPRHPRIGREAVPVVPAPNTPDRATATMPRLVHAIRRAHDAFAAARLRPCADRLIEGTIVEKPAAGVFARGR